MNFKEELAKRRLAARNAAFLLFVARYRPDGAVHYVFCESPADVQFYQHVLYRAYANQKFDFVPCNGKSLVFHTRSLLSTEGYQHARISYIVDKDHDGFLKNVMSTAKDVFVTDYYSVESYLCTSGTFSSCVQQYCGLQRDDEALAEACEMFARFQQAFASAMLDPMSTLIVLRRRGGPDSIHLDGIKLHDYLSLKPDMTLAIVASLSKRILADWNGEPDGSEPAKSTKLLKSLKRKDPRLWIRGKFFSWWYSRAFNIIGRAISEDFLDKNGNRIKCTVSMGDSHFIPFTKIYASPSLRLKKFFNRRFKEAAEVL